MQQRFDGVIIGIKRPPNDRTPRWRRSVLDEDELPAPNHRGSYYFTLTE